MQGVLGSNPARGWSFSAMPNYAPNFEKVGRAYCFWSASVSHFFVPTVTFKPLKLRVL